MLLKPTLNVQSLVLILLGLSCSFATAQLPETYQMLINSDKELDTIDLFSFKSRIDLETGLNRELEISDFCNRQINRTFEFEYFDSKLFPNVLIYKSCPDEFGHPHHPRIDELKLFIYSDDSIRYDWGEVGSINSISKWVYDYYLNELEMFECFTPSVSRFVIVCDDNYPFENLKNVISEGVDGYLKAIEDVSRKYYNISFEKQPDTTVSVFRNALPFQVSLAIQDWTERPPPPPPPDSMMAIYEKLIGFDEQFDTVNLPKESFQKINENPYEDTLTANFSTTWNHDGEYIPYKIWKNQDTINITRHMGVIFYEPEEVKEYVVDKYSADDYYIGELNTYGRTSVYFYQTDKYLLRNDTIFVLLEKNKLSKDSINKLAVLHKMGSSRESQYLDILKENSYSMYDVLFYKGIGCTRAKDVESYYHHKVKIDGYWETDFGTFFKIILFDKTDFSQGNCTHRIEYFIKDNFEFYGVNSESKRIEAFKLEQMKSDLEKYKQEYCD